MLYAPIKSSPSIAMLNLAHLGKSSIRGQAVASTIPRTAIGIMEVQFQNSNSFSSSCAIFNSMTAYGADHIPFFSFRTAPETLPGSADSAWHDYLGSVYSPSISHEDASSAAALHSKVPLPLIPFSLPLPPRKVHVPLVDSGGPSLLKRLVSE